MSIIVAIILAIGMVLAGLMIGLGYIICTRQMLKWTSEMIAETFDKTWKMTNSFLQTNDE